jgi:hypothetical protein
MYVPGYIGALRAQGLRGFMIPINGCAPIAAFNITQQCAMGMGANIEAAAAMRARIVMLAFLWPDRPITAVDRAGHSMGEIGWPVFRHGLEQTIERLRAAGKTVILVGPIPQPNYDMPSVISRQIAFGRGIQAPLSESAEAFLQRHGDQEIWMRGYAGIVPIFPSHEFAVGDRYSFLLNGRPAFADANHLSAWAAEQFGPLFDEALRTAKQSRHRSATQ